jgi:hypothetical protein
MKYQEFGKMRKQVIAAATAIALGIATTATGTTAFARGGGGGHGGGGAWRFSQWRSRDGPRRFRRPQGRDKSRQYWPRSFGWPTLW